MRCWIYIFWMVLITGLNSCASSGTLGGGPDDKKPPKLLPEKSSGAYARQCVERSFVFTFDEFVEVKDALRQVLVSPPLVYIPRVKARGRQVSFTFNEKEVLKENTTYIINFGEAIRDFRASNPLSNFKHVFSTGDIIDSLVVRGKVIDEAKGEGAEGISVLLFDDLRDSAIVKKKPFYFTKTGKNGEFSLENLKKDTFRLIAIKDENSNLQFDELSELIGFDTQWVMWNDSTVENRNLVLSKPEVSPKYAGFKHKGHGLLGVKWHIEPKALPQAQLMPPPASFASWLKGDSLMIHYHYDMDPDSFELITGGRKVKLAIPDTSQYARKLTYQLEFGSQGVLPGDTLWIDWERPVDQIDHSRISLTDSAGAVNYTLVKEEPKKTGIFAAMNPNIKYELLMLPGAVSDYHRVSHDTIAQRFRIYQPDKLSKLAVDIKSLDSTKQYLVYLTRGNKILKSAKIQNKGHQIIYFDRLKSDTYGIQLVEDLNGNGMADAASYWEQRAAEKVYNFPLEKLRESWTLETEIDIKQTQAPVQNTPGLR